MFNLSGSEIFFLLLIGLVVLGPEKLPDAMRKAGRLYQEVRRITGGIQTDIRSTFEDPVNELRKTADQAKRAFTGADEPTPPRQTAGQTDPPTSTPATSETVLAGPEFIPYEPPTADSEALEKDDPT